MDAPDTGGPGGPPYPATVRPVAEADLPRLSLMRSRDSEPGFAGRISEEGWVRVLSELAADSRSLFEVAVVGAELAGYAVATPGAVDAQRRAIVRSPRLWSDVARSIVRDPRLLGPAVRRLARLVWPLRPAGDPSLRLLDIIVSSDFRGAGIGATLLSSILASAASAGHTTIGLSVLADNVPAIRLYERLGFTIDRRTTRADGRQVLTMSCPLEPST